MPYVECEHCGLTVLTGAYWSSIDYCAGCGATLPHRVRSVTPIAAHPRFRSHHIPPVASVVPLGRPSAA